MLQMLQGFSSSLFYWDGDGKSFRSKSGIYVEHLSQTSLHAIVNQFTYAATCLQLVQIVISKVEKSVRLPSPTLRAFSNSVSSWLKVRTGYYLSGFLFSSIFYHIFAVTVFFFCGRGCVI